MTCDDELEGWHCQLPSDHAGRHVDINERGNLIMWSRDHTVVVERRRTS